MFSFFCDHENSLLNFSIIPVYFHFNLYSMLERFHRFSFLFPKGKSIFSLDFSKVLLTRACSSLIHKYDSLFARLSYFYFFFSIFVLSSTPLRALVLDFFNVQVLFLALHTLINEFFFFPSFPALAYFPVRQSLPRDYHDFSSFFTLESLSSYPSLFLRQSRTVTTIHPSLGASQLVAFCHPFWTHELFPFCWRPFSLMSKRPYSFCRPLTHSLSITDVLFSLVYAWTKSQINRQTYLPETVRKY